MTGQNIVTLVAVGDVGPKRANAETLFDSSRSILRGADITFGQLESSLSLRGAQLHIGLGSIAHPRVGDALADAGFDVMSFASNHSLDYSEEALFDTLEVMKQKQIEVIGAGRDIVEARRPAIFDRKQLESVFWPTVRWSPKGSMPERTSAVWRRSGLQPHMSRPTGSRGRRRGL